MRTTSFLLVAVMFIAVSLLAQGAVAPPNLTTFAPYKPFNVAAFGGTSTAGAAQIHLVPHPTLPGTYFLSMTVTVVTGGSGGYDIVTGLYNANTQVTTPDKPNLAAGINTSSNEFGFVMYHNGLMAVYESSGKPGSTGNEVWLASRPNITSAWKDIGKISNIPTANSQGYWDPSLANVGGKLHMLYMLERGTGQSDIVIAPLDPVKLTLGTPTVIIKTTTASADANSPTPIVDSTGELIAVSHHDQQNSNDHYMSFDLDPNTPAVQFITDSAWINNGAFAAGTFFDSKGVAPYTIHSMQTVWWTGGRAALGGKMEVSLYAPIRTITKPPYVSVLLLSSSFLTTPLPIPGFTGKFGINPLVLFPLGGGFSHNPLTGKATLSFTVPNDPVLKGVAIPGQSATINMSGASGPEYYLGNTAALTIL